MSRTGENIYKRKDGRWEGRYIAYYDINGKAKYKYLYAKTYSEVKNKLLDAKVKAYSNTLKVSQEDKVNYDVWLDEWLQIKKAGIKESTYIRYKNMIENHIKPELGKYPISKITTSQMEQYVIDKLNNGKLDGSGGLSAKSISDILMVIKETFKYAQSCDVTVVCYFDRISYKRNRHEMRVLTNLEEQRLLSVLMNDVDNYKLGVFICLYTGIRIGELCALQWKNISLEEKTIKIDSTLQRLQCEEKNSIKKTHIVITEPKSMASIRIIPIPDFVIDMISSFKASQNAFLLSGECIIVEPRTMQNKFKKYLKEGKINDANFHSLRHTFATRCIEVGFDIKTLSELLGHSSVKITLDKYVHSSMQLKRDNMKKLKKAI